MDAASPPGIVTNVGMVARSIGVGVALLALGCARATPDAPLSTAERSALPGAIYFLRGDEAPQLLRLALGTGEITPITEVGPAAFLSELAPDRRGLALTLDDQLVLTRADGQEPKVLAPSEGLAWYPRFSPDGKVVLFESSRASFRDLYTVELGSGSVRRLTHNAEGNFDGVWSPDGKQIAFASSRHGQLDLFVMNADGSEPRRLTRHPGDSVKPLWSPDGRQLAFLSGRDGRDDLLLVPAQGGEVVSVSGSVTGRDHQGAFVERYHFTPNGQSLVYSVRTPKRGSKIWIWEASTGQSRRLSGEAHDDTDPALSPDGAHLVFTSKHQGRSGIWLMQIDGRKRTRLTEDGGAWLPRWLEVVEGREDS